jgi:hypothetical protein
MQPSGLRCITAMGAGVLVGFHNGTLQLLRPPSTPSPPPLPPYGIVVGASWRGHEGGVVAAAETGARVATLGEHGEVSLTNTGNP